MKRSDFEYEKEEALAMHKANHKKGEPSFEEKWRGMVNLRISQHERVFKKDLQHLLVDESNSFITPPATSALLYGESPAVSIMKGVEQLKKLGREIDKETLRRLLKEKDVYGVLSFVYQKHSKVKKNMMELATFGSAQILVDSEMARWAYRYTNRLFKVFGNA